MTRLLLVFVGVSSALWFLFNLPVMGKGRFTGVTIHSNLSGPLAGLAVLISFIVAIHRRSWKWAVLAAVCSLPCVVSGSRAGLVALGVAGVVVLLVRFRLNQAAVLVAILGFVTYFLLDRGVFNMPSLQALTSYLQEKGLANTRDHLWKARLYEFSQHPWIGIGVGMAEGAGGSYLDDNRFNVEPGSSYLAVLAMTGIVGVTGFAITILYMAFTVARSFPAFSPQNQAEILGVAAFLAVHALAEGWILAVGSPFTFMFWLTCGRALDLAEGHRESSQSGSKEHERPSRRTKRNESVRSSKMPLSLPTPNTKV
jgi:O-antigen ligase